MNDKQLQTKRQTKKGLRKLHAKVAPRRKQRVSTLANPEMLDSDVPNSSIVRVLTTILLINVVGIGALYIGLQWNKTKGEEISSSAMPIATVDLRNFNADLETAFVISGDTYATFAARHNVDEAELRRYNNDAQPFAGKPLYLPPQKITAKPAVVAVSDRPALPVTNSVVKIDTAQAQLVKPMIPRAVAVAEESGQSYKVQSGDSIWRISKQHKVSQESLMQLNNLKGPRDLKAGMTLSIPAQ